LNTFTGQMWPLGRRLDTANTKQYVGNFYNFRTIIIAVDDPTDTKLEMYNFYCNGTSGH
jgi:hypothetical protein